MDEQKLILNDGTEIPGGHAYLSEGKLWLMTFGSEMTMAAAAAIFLDEEKTARIEYEHSITDIYEGFTVCRMLKVDGDGNLTVTMVKGE